MQNWRRYEHDNFAYMKNGSIEYPGKRKLLETQITFIQPYIEKKSTIIYTYIGMILCLLSCKGEILRKLVKRADIICSNKNSLRQELKYSTRISYSEWLSDMDN